MSLVANASRYKVDSLGHWFAQLCSRTVQWTPAWESAPLGLVFLQQVPLPGLQWLLSYLRGWIRWRWKDILLSTSLNDQVERWYRKRWMVWYFFLCILGYFGSQSKNIYLLSGEKRFKWRGQVLSKVSPNYHIRYLVQVAQFGIENDLLNPLGQFQVKGSFWGSVSVESGPFWPTDCGQFIFLNTDQETLPPTFNILIMAKEQF